MIHVDVTLHIADNACKRSISWCPIFKSIPLYAHRNVPFSRDLWPI